MRSTARSVETEPTSEPPVVLGPYRLVERIARGGMADVHLAREGGRLVVVKRVLEHLAGTVRLQELLIAEAELVTKLRHPNIVRALDQDTDERGEPYIGFEYVEGVDLRALLRLCTQRKTPLPVAVSLYIVREVLRALDHAHRARDARGQPLKVVHRDVTPSNVLLGFDGDVKLCDFGIASAACMPSVPADRIEGKTGYMSPEQARGRRLDKRSDIYAVGIMLWELLSGRRMRPKKGEPALAAAARGYVPPFSAAIGDELVGILQRALARRRKERFASAGAMLRDLDAYCRGAGIDIHAVDLAAWLCRVLEPERARAEALRRSAEALASEAVEQSGPRLVRRPRLHRTPPHRTVRDDRPLLRLRRGLVAALAACALTLMLLWTLAWLAA